MIIGHQNEITIEIMGLGDKCCFMSKELFFGVQLRDNQFCVYRLSAAYGVCMRRLMRSKHENNAAANLKFQPGPFSLSFHNVMCFNISFIFLETWALDHFLYTQLARIWNSILNARPSRWWLFKSLSLCKAAKSARKKGETVSRNVNKLAQME